MSWAEDGRATFAYGEERIQAQPHIVWHPPLDPAEHHGPVRLSAEVPGSTVEAGLLKMDEQLPTDADEAVAGREPCHRP